MHNKKYALKLVQDKLNGLNNYSYSKIAILSGYKKLQIVRFANLLKEKDIDLILTHGLSGKQSNNSPSKKKYCLLRVLKINIRLLVYHNFEIFIMKILFIILK